jgi:endo-1,4-beta-mannosidase
MASGLVDSWVTRDGDTFRVAGAPFRFVGFNAYDLPFKAARTRATAERVLEWDGLGPAHVTLLEAGTSETPAEQVDRTLAAAARLGLSVVRTWAFNSAPGRVDVFHGPDGTPNEPQFRRLDQILESARGHGLKVILVLENNWADFGGIAATAARFGVSKLEFFTDRRCSQAYRARVAQFVTRVNTLSGRAYAEDPVILAWELMNEPRMDRRDDPTGDAHLYDPTGERLGAWMAEMSRHVKSLDPRHLVGPGSEGHGFGGWGASTEGYGGDPLRVMDQPDIDFFTFHPYLNEAWTRFTVERARRLIGEMVAAGHARGKPVVMEEWGVNKTEPVLDARGREIVPGAPEFARVRADWYRLLLEELRRAGGDGSLVWMLQTSAQEPNFGISLGTPFEEAVADLPLLEILAAEARLVRSGSTWRGNQDM